LGKKIPLIGTTKGKGKKVYIPIADKSLRQIGKISSITAPSEQALG
jgi:hypothetical protein